MKERESKVTHLKAGLASKRGYTLMEVTVAMTVIAILSAGVVATQNAAMIGGMQARRMDIASKVADTWIERLRADALNWTIDNNITTPNHLWIKSTNLTAAADPIDPATGWVRPSGATVIIGESPFFDSIGREVVGSAASIQPIFCTNIRLESVRYNELGVAPANTVAIRAEVRVFFRKDMGTQAAGCDVPAAVDDPAMQFIYASTVIRENGL